jgi:hypothetical protein
MQLQPISHDLISAKRTSNPPVLGGKRFEKRPFDEKYEEGCPASACPPPLHMVGSH